MAYFIGLKLGLQGPPKRLLAALGWAAGVAVPAWTIATPSSRMEITVAAGLLAVLAWINLQSYALVDGKTESDSGRKPGKVLRVTALAISVIGLCWAYHAYPAKRGHWSALGSVAVIQALLKWAPDELVHPAGEWSIALLGAFSILG